MALGQHAYLYRKTVARVLGSALIFKKVTQIILSAYIKRFYTNVKPPTRHEKCIEEVDYTLATKLIFAKGEMEKHMQKWSRL